MQSISSARYGVTVWIAIFAKMKVIAIFMTILLFLSGFDFCKDDFAMGDGCKEKTGLVKTDQERKDKHEVCSPFCQCARCPFSILLPQEQYVTLAYEPLKIRFPRSIARNPTGISPPVWQPPKVA
jgi:hypothetical protein